VDESHNPYQPPKANVETLPGVRPINIAGKGRRFGTFVVDYIGNLLLGVAIGFIDVLFFGDRAPVIARQIPHLLLGICLWFLYYTFFEGIWARTPGKWVFGTVVVTEDGSKPGFGTILIRTLCRLIPFEPFSFFGETGWHDGMSDTRVVLARAG
jgi:uncharacterized RDD family membrane protein YckC